MKKWVILVLVVLGGLLLALQYVARKNEKAMIRTAQPAPTEQEGVALPSSSTDYVSPDMAMGDGSNYQSNLFLPAVQTSYTGACQGGSLEEMRRTHGRYWGIGAKDVAFNFEETKKMYEMMSNYVGCVAVAREDLALCNTLPDELMSDSRIVDADSTPRRRCREQAVNMLFEAYMAGKVTNPVFCQSALSYWRAEYTAKFPAPDFCKAAGGGMKRAVDFLAKYLPNVKNQGMPTSKSSCGGDEKCLDIFETYNAISDGNAGACPRSSNSYCEAVITKVPTPCESIVRDMSKNYCLFVETVKKGSGGYIGITKEQVKTYSAQQALKIAADAAERRQKAEEESRLRNEAELQRKANDKAQEQMNKQLKKLLGKE